LSSLGHNRHTHKNTADIRWNELQQRLGYRFTSLELLQRALTHRSFGADHNERLEFLGDAVLDLAISSLLFDQFAGRDEGDLSRARAHLVREDSLHHLALELGLPALLRLSDGEAKGGGAKRPSILANALEAVIAAVFLDGGFVITRDIVARIFSTALASNDVANNNKDAKTELQEWLQARRLPVPLYRICATRGQAHEQVFEVECHVADLGLTRTGEGRSRRMAEQNAASRVLDEIKAGLKSSVSSHTNPGGWRK
jgi:ribonuclease III